MERSTMLIIVALFLVVGGGLLVAQTTSVDHSGSEATRVEAPGTKVETGDNGTRIQAPGVDITVPKDKRTD